MKNHLATSFIALTTALATPAVADVTPADVWSNQQAFFSAMGVTLSGDLQGDQLNGAQMNVILPQGIASMQISTDAPVTMADNGDGTVAITYPSPMTINVKGGAPNEGSFDATFTMTHDGYTIIASGNQGDIDYASNGQNLRFEAGDLAVDGSSEAMTFDGFVTLESWTGTSKVTEGNVITYSAQSQTGDSVADFTFGIDNVTSNSKQTTLPIDSIVALTLPVGGSDMMNLSAALRDGLSVFVESAGEGTSSETLVTLGDEVLNSQSTTTGEQVATMNMTEDGLVLSADAADFDIVINDPLVFPAPLEFGMERVTANYDIPLNASEGAQDFRIATGLTGITLGETIWGLFDPAGMLPRDPADVTFDVTGTGTNGMDLLDIAAWMTLMDTPPIEVDTVTIENLRISAVGAEATATGAMTFDWTDFQTIPGIARPEGQVTVNLSGANALMDNLAAMGVIPEADLMMPRMMLGMFATPVGDDQLESVLEVNSEGHVLANGQRLQ